MQGALSPLFFLAAWCLAIGTAFADAPPVSAPATPKLKIIATFSVLGDVVANVGGDRVAITTLVGPDCDAHTYEPTPADSRAIATAALVFENGLGFETWLDKLYAASGSRAPRVAACSGINPRTLVEDGREETDPHAWQDVTNVVAMTKSIAFALDRADPKGQAIYNKNALAYIAELESLHADLLKEAQTLPAERRKLVTTHDSLGYFASRYGFEVSGSALSSISTEEADPSAQRIAQVIREIRKAGVPAVFLENMQNPKLMEQIAREAKVKVVTSLYTDALGAKGSKGETYLKMMRANMDAIVGALKP